jgi:hypothetical protein
MELTTLRIHIILVHLRDRRGEKGMLVVYVKVSTVEIVFVRRIRMVLVRDRSKFTRGKAGDGPTQAVLKKCAPFLKVNFFSHDPPFVLSNLFNNLPPHRINSE